MEREKKFQCPLCGAALDSPIQNPGCAGFPEWHDEGVADIKVEVGYIDDEEEDESD